MQRTKVGLFESISNYGLRLGLAGLNLRLLNSFGFLPYSMRVLFLYAEVTGYLMACLRALKQHPEVTEIRLYEGLSTAETHFDFSAEDLSVSEATHQSANQLWPEMEAFQPDVVFVSGWMLRKYYTLARRLKKTGATLIIGNDTPWYGNLRQRIGALVSPAWLRPVYDFMWVPGIYQYEFARRLGFPKERIRTGMLSADVDAFSGGGEVPLPPEGSVKTLLSVGSFLPNKGMHRLYAAFSKLLAGGLTGWELHLVGAGPLAGALKETAQIRISSFVQPAHMPALFKEAQAFALASEKESWGIVVHEAACAGLPLLITQNAGSTEAFVHPNYNGFLFNPSCPDSLESHMHRLLTLSPETLAQMGARSKTLSRNHTPELWAQLLVNMHQEARLRK